MNDLVVIVPSRGRPENARRLVDAFQDCSADLILAVDNDDPTVNQYMEIESDHWLVLNDRKRLGPTLNQYAKYYASVWGGPCRYLGFMGDDHLPRTQGWDKLIVEALDELGTGIVYGNDLIQGPNLPTAVFMTSDIVRALGYMCPPNLIHMYLDNVWKDWGEAIGRIRYLPDVIIEHMHPLVGKAVEDDSYRATAALLGPDGIGYWAYKTLGAFDADVEKLRALL